MAKPITDDQLTAQTQRQSSVWQSRCMWLMAAPLSGMILGLSAPGFGCWYLAWVGLVPFFLMTAQARSYKAAALWGYVYGLAYNFVALSWLLKLSPPWWLGVQSPTHVASAALLAWVNVCVIQGTVSLVLACLCRLFFTKVSNRWQPLTLSVLPVLWVLLTHWVFINADLLLLSFSSIEYSQYLQRPLIQIASCFGGVGVEALIVVFNLALAFLIATIFQQKLFTSIAASNLRSAWMQFAAAVALVLIVVAWGDTAMNAAATGSSLREVSVVQLNLGSKYDTGQRKPDAAEIWSVCKEAIQRCPQGNLVVFSESILPEYVLMSSDLRDRIQAYARAHDTDLVMGVWEKTRTGQTYNSVISFPASERLRSAIYRKRYLMPVGEFEPWIMRFLGEGAKKTLHFSLMPDIQRGIQATFLPTARGAITVLVCAENSQPLLCADSVTAETNLIVNLGTLTWFQGSGLGDLSKACAVFRAIENRRSLVYASDTGPSFIVDPSGRMRASSRWSDTTIIRSSAPLSSEITPFNSFCRALPRF